MEKFVDLLAADDGDLRHFGIFSDCSKNANLRYDTN